MGAEVDESVRAPEDSRPSIRHFRYQKNEQV